MPRHTPFPSESAPPRAALWRIARPAAVAATALCLVASAAIALPASAATAQPATASSPSSTEANATGIRLDGEVPTTAELEVPVEVPGATASAADGRALEVVVSVTDPTGVVTLLSDQGSTGLAFTPRVAGDFIVSYAVTADDGTVSETTRTIIAGGGAAASAEAPAATLDSTASAAPTASDAPDVRFGAIGDIHNSWVELGEAYDFWAEQGVQTAMFVGDLTNNATTAEFDGLKNAIDQKAELGIPAIASMGNHDVAGIGSYALFGQATGGQKPNADYTVNGYHVISVSPGAGRIDADTGLPSIANQGDYAYARSWLQQRLAINTAEDPTKPVMVLVHHPLRCTHYVSEEWHGSGLSSGCGDTFESVFDDFPQAVVWGGHIHTPQNIPTSIWQGPDVRTGAKAGKGFTTVNAPPLAYYEFESGVIGTSPTSRANDTTPDDAGDNRQTAIVEITGSKVTVKNYDLLADQWIDQTWSWDVADAIDESKSYDERFPYNDTLRSAQTTGPVWPVEAAIAVGDIAGTTAMVSFPQAAAAPNAVGDIVHKYRYTTIDIATGVEVNTFQQWSGFYNLPMPADRRHEVWNLLPQREYEVSVTPYNAWGEAGAPLTARFTTGEAAEGELPFDPADLTFEDLQASVPTADLLDFAVRDGVPVDESPRGWQLSAGAAAGFERDPDADAEVVIGAEGAETAVRTDMWTAADYAMLQDGFTLDVTFRLDSIDSGYVDVFGGMQSGGIGLEAVGISDTSYELQFWYASPRPSVSLRYGHWYHVTATYDGTGAQMYVNGIEKADVERASFTVTPSVVDARYMAIGGDANGSGGLDDATIDGRIAGAEIYSAPLGEVDAYRVAMRELSMLDTIAPMVRVNGGDPEDAVVGQAYTLPEGEAVDASGDVRIIAAVTGPDGQPVDTASGASADRRVAAPGGSFVPQTAGEYIVTYTATDAAGNESSASATVMARAAQTGGADGGAGDASGGGGANAAGAGGGGSSLAATGGSAMWGLAALTALLGAAGVLLMRARGRRAVDAAE